MLRYDEAGDEASEASLLEAAIDLGAPLCDGIGDLVSLSGFRDPARALDLAYRILQAARMRFTRTEYISCPSCGRTLFDLEEVTARIKRRTEHLRGVKIAHPQLICIGIDEGTAIIVTGGVLEVMGSHSAFVFAGTDAPEEGDEGSVEVPSGGRYDLVRRRVPGK